VAHAQQAKPDLSGTWELDRKRSNVGRSHSADAPEQIKITYAEPELRIVRTTFAKGQRQEIQFAYYTDGRGETNPTTAWLTTNPGSTFDRPAETKSRTNWSGEKVLTRSRFQSEAGGVVLIFEITVEWRLSRDGKTLTQTTQTTALPTTMPNSTFMQGTGTDFKVVYNLISK
jgi:hypothetical protein